MSIKDYTNYKHYLKDVLEQRLHARRRYSLRAFARDLGMNPARLSCVLNDKKGLSAEAALNIGQKLGLSPDECDHFCSLIQYQHGRTAAVRRLAEQRIQRQRAGNDFFELSRDTFNIIADWYHFAILELIGTTGFTYDAPWIARRLGISPHEASQAVERLQRLGYVAETERGLERCSFQVRTTADVPSEAIRKHHKQVLAKAADALESQPVDVRDVSTIMMAVDEKRLPEAKKMIERFRRELSAFLESGASKDEVYSLAIQLFRLSEKNGAPRREDTH
jgi:uncharacterized protein (TIGR02147 family)